MNSVKVFPTSIKSIKPIQKYPHIIESYACVLKIFVAMDKEWSINVLISFGICSTPKLSITIIMHVQSNPMNSNIRVLIKNLNPMTIWKNINWKTIRINSFCCDYNIITKQTKQINWK